MITDNEGWKRKNKTLMEEILCKNFCYSLALHILVFYYKELHLCCDSVSCNRNGLFIQCIFRYWLYMVHIGIKWSLFHVLVSKALDQIRAGSDFCMNHLCNRTPSGKSPIKNTVFVLADHAFAHALSRVYWAQYHL